METLIIGTVLAIVMTVGLSVFGSRDYEWYNTAAWIFAIFTALAAVAGIFIIIIFSWSWKSSEYKVKILNHEYHTNYTQEDLFYASDVIDIIRQLDRSRIEINGDLMKDDK